jgi:hypothetical protein
VSVVIVSPFTASHNLTVPSSEAEASISPSGDQANSSIERVCPSRVLVDDEAVDELDDVWGELQAGRKITAVIPTRHNRLTLQSAFSLEPLISILKHEMHQGDHHGRPGILMSAISYAYALLAAALHV